jgi:purine-binding chemotaxis protein CheW
MELLVMLSIDGRRCALRALDVNSVMEVESITPVPRAPDHILGLCTKRSQTLTVIDCLRAAGFAKQSDPIGKRAAVVTYHGHSYALLVDEIEDVEDTANEVLEVSGGFGGEWAALAEGMVETRAGPALLLSVSQIVNSKEELPDAA